MKHLTKLTTTLMLLLVSFGFTACSDDDDDKNIPSSPIVGNWQQVNNAGTIITLTFRNDKSGIINFYYPNGIGDSNENFEYDYIEAERELKIIGSSLGGEYDVTLTATKLQLRTYNYSEQRYYTYTFERK